MVLTASESEAVRVVQERSLEAKEKWVFEQHIDARVPRPGLSDE